MIYHTKIIKSRQITTQVQRGKNQGWCDLSHKNNKIKANHNGMPFEGNTKEGVIYHTKIIKSRQITTQCRTRHNQPWCDLSHKNNKIKANHNNPYSYQNCTQGVIYHTKIIKSRQITTTQKRRQRRTRCDLSHKNNKIKANHNMGRARVQVEIGVIYHTKTLVSTKKS